ncbi:MAG: ribonuclease III [Mycoplasmataceae bacterium]|jgi:ribonuclease-3|nr:ribonuclease III [Mycoplasmataceae bacterium]
MDQKLIQLLQKYNISVKDSKIYDTAFTHISYRNTNNTNYDYEKLEFLGDAILNKIVSKYIYSIKNSLEVGDMSKVRALMTQGKTEALAAKELGLLEFIKFVGDKKTISDSILEDVYEALIGAIYLDSGMAKTTEFVHTTLIDFYNQHPQDITDDYKTKLQELVYKIFKKTPVYKTVKNKNNEYESKLFIKNVVYGEGVDKKIKEAEQKAAKICYETLSKNN